MKSVLKLAVVLTLAVAAPLAGASLAGGSGDDLFLLGHGDSISFHIGVWNYAQQADLLNFSSPYPGYRSGSEYTGPIASNPWMARYQSGPSFVSRIGATICLCTCPAAVSRMN
jgi:hypothetical protein